MPSYIDAAYKIRDNQFWYSDCSFAECIDNKKYITIRITGFGESTLEHAVPGKDGRPTKSFKFIDPDDRKWWKEHRHQTVQLELLSTDKEAVEDNPQAPNHTQQDEVIYEVDTQFPQVRKIHKPGKLNSEGSVLCIGLDIAWFGGSANNKDSQYDCLGWINFPSNSEESSQVEYGLKRFALPERDIEATVLLKEIEGLLSEYQNIKRVIFAIDAPIQACERVHLPVREAVSKKGTLEMRACEKYFSEMRKAIDEMADGPNEWQPQIQAGAPLASRIQCLLKGLMQLDFNLWEKEITFTGKLVIECFPAEAIWAMKRLGYYSESMTAKEVKAYKNQGRKLLVAEEVGKFVDNVLHSFADATGKPETWKEFSRKFLFEWMLQDKTWQVPGDLYRGGKLLDDVVDTAICLATAVSYAYGEFHVWQDENFPEDGHIIGPGAIEGLL